jgi:hypothetical protein
MYAVALLINYVTFYTQRIYNSNYITQQLPICYTFLLTAHDFLLYAACPIASLTS